MQAKYALVTALIVIIFIFALASALYQTQQNNARQDYLNCLSANAPQDCAYLPH